MGWVAERLKAHAWRACGLQKGLVGSNPTPSVASAVPWLQSSPFSPFFFHFSLLASLELLPVPVRTLDALHLASIEFLRAQEQDVRLATYDERLGIAARRLGVKVMALKQ